MEQLNSSPSHELLRLNSLIAFELGRIEKGLTEIPWWKKLFNL